MRLKVPLVVAAGLLAALGLLAGSRSQTLAQGSQTGQERLVVFEMLARED